METAINETRPPSASAARLRSNIFYFLMKREEMKRKTHLLKKPQMWWRRTRGRKRWARLSNFYLYFLDCFLLPERTHLCPHTLNTHNKSAVSYYRSLSRWMVVIAKCGSAGSAGLSLSVCRPPPPPRGLWHNRVDFSLKRPQSWYDQWKWAGWKWEREIDFPFSLLTDCTLWIQSLMSSLLCTDGPNWFVIESKSKSVG